MRPLRFPRAWSVSRRPSRSRSRTSDGTIRGIGDIGVRNEDADTGVPGLYVAEEDTKPSRLVAGASSGGAVSTPPGLSSGTWAGRATARRSPCSGRQRAYGAVFPGCLMGRPARPAKHYRGSRLTPRPADKNLSWARTRTRAERCFVWSARHAGGSHSPCEAALWSPRPAGRWPRRGPQKTRGMHRRLDHPSSTPISPSG